MLLNQTFFFESVITKFQYKITTKLMWRFKSKLTIILWDFMKLHFVRILLSIWSHYVNYTRWSTDEITDLNSIIFKKSIRFTSSSSFWRKFMNRTCWNIFLTIFSRQHFLINRTISIHESNTSQSSSTCELDI